jgi:hypothetical protein
VSLRAMHMIASARLRGLREPREGAREPPPLTLQLIDAFEGHVSLRNLALVGSPEGV